MKEEALRLCKIFGKSKVSDDAEIHMDNLNRWEKNGTENNRRKKSGRKIKNPELKTILKNFVINTRAQISHFHQKDSSLTPRNSVLKMKIDPQTLKLSWGWYRKFLKRNSFSMRKPTSNTQKPFSKVEKDINEFKDRMKEILKLNVYELLF